MSQSKNINKKTSSVILLKLRGKVPFLRGIPESIYSHLDTSEFIVPSEELMKAREELEKTLDCFIMTYKVGVFTSTIPLRSHLCSTIKSANLTLGQKHIIKTYEEKFESFKVNFVAYQKPLIFISPKKSPLFNYYNSHPFLRLNNLNYYYMIHQISTYNNLLA